MVDNFRCVETEQEVPLLIFNEEALELTDVFAFIWLTIVLTRFFPSGNVDESN